MSFDPSEGVGPPSVPDARRRVADAIPALARLRAPYRPQDDADIAALARSANRARVVTTTAVLGVALAAGLLLPRSAAAEPAVHAPPAVADAAVLDAGSDAAVPAGRVQVVPVDVEVPPAGPAPAEPAPEPVVAAPVAPSTVPPATPTAPATAPGTSTAPTGSAPPATGAATGLTEAQRAQRKAERKAQRKAERKAARKAQRKAERKAERKAQRKAERKAQRKAARKAAKKARSGGDVTMTGAVRSSRAARERVSLADWRASEHARMIVWRESNGRCDVVSSNGLWRGCWQMTMTLWRGFGGLKYASSPDRATCAEQDQVAYRVWLSSWWGPWGG